MGLLLLFTRVKMVESSLFEALEGRHSRLKRGDWWSLLIDARLRPRYLGAIAQGMPIWFVVGVLLTFSPEIGRELRLTGEIDVGRAIMHCYGGAVLGDFLAGLYSQALRRRRAAIATFLLMTAAGMAIFVTFHDRSFDQFCQLAAFMGFASGYWAVLLSSTAEQFGTNLRSTVTSTVPNFIRATVIPMSTLFLWLGARTSLLQAAAWISGATLALAGYCLLRSRETFGASLEFIEEPERTDSILFFDGECNLCNSVVDFCVRRGIAEHRGVRFASLQGETAQRLLPESLRGPAPGTLVLHENGAIRLRSDAALQLLVWGGGFTGLLALCLKAIPQVLSDAVYAPVARSRYSIWGRRPACRLPLADERSWFLP
jgi:predicted DCC family thiol-disulfide oxidoreductase YuxK